MAAPAWGKWLAAGITAWWISTPAAVQALVVLMVCDYATGVLSALVCGRLSSAEGYRGLGRKVLTLTLVTVAHFVGWSIHLGYDLGSIVAIAFAVNEAISITENCARAGVPIPEAMLAALLRAKRVTGRGRTAAEVERDLRGGGK